MDKITIGTQLIVFGIGWLIVDDIDPQTGLLSCIDQEGGEHEISESRVDSIIHEHDPF
jgi:hypothetical protein